MTSPDVERILYSDRTILHEYDPETREDREGWAEIAHEAVRAMNHITNGPAIPAPVVYSVLGNLTGLGHMLPQLCEQLASGLARSLEEFDVYDNKRDPAQSVDQATDSLRLAADLARQLGAALSDAQVAINAQGYNDPAGDEGDAE